MFVLPEHRHKGMAKKLWRKAQRVCAENGNASYYWVRSSSYALPVYKSFGFRASGDREEVNGISFEFMEKDSREAFSQFAKIGGIIIKAVSRRVTAY